MSIEEIIYKVAADSMAQEIDNSISGQGMWANNMGKAVVTIGSTTDNTTMGKWGDMGDGYYRYTIPAEETMGDSITIPPINGWNELQEVFEMQVYDVIVVDTKECEVLHRQQVIAEDEKSAMLELDITEDIKKKQRKGQAKFIFNQLGGFNRYTRKVRIKEEDEE